MRWRALIAIVAAAVMVGVVVLLLLVKRPHRSPAASGRGGTYHTGLTETDPRQPPPPAAGSRPPGRPPSAAPPGAPVPAAPPARLPSAPPVSPETAARLEATERVRHSVEDHIDAVLARRPGAASMQALTCSPEGDENGRPGQFTASCRIELAARDLVAGGRVLEALEDEESGLSSMADTLDLSAPQSLGDAGPYVLIFTLRGVRSGD